VLIGVDVLRLQLKCYHVRPLRCW